jgi:hypothetical protein
LKALRSRPRHSTPSGSFQLLQEQGADFLLSVKANQETLHRQIASQFQGKRTIPFVATDQEISHGRDITWTLLAKETPPHNREAWIGTRDGREFRRPICSSPACAPPQRRC